MENYGNLTKEVKTRISEENFDLINFIIENHVIEVNVPTYADISTFFRSALNREIRLRLDEAREFYNSKDKK